MIKTKTRLSNLRSLMKEQGFDAVLISSTSNIIYISDYSGFSPTEREAFLFVTMNNAWLIVSPLHFEEVKNLAKNVSVLERTRDNPFKSIVEDLARKNKIKTCGFEDASLTYAEYKIITPLFTKFKPVDLSSLRLIKSPAEIESIKKACSLGDEAYSHILKRIRIGMTEKDVALELEWFIRKENQDISFPPVVAFDEHAAIPHHNNGDKKLKTNTLVLLDFGTKVENYCSDMTRVFVYGKATGKQKTVHKTVVDAQQEAINYINKKLEKKQKAIAQLVDSTARDYVVKKNFPPFNHSSHGIGLDLHEKPHISTYKNFLENGMVFSIEPGIYLPGQFGVRIEDIFAIDNNKLIPLTSSPKDLLEI
jgi:Xaa-Pro aminopeptidase